MIQKNDITERKFNRTLRGYDPVEVKYFLDMLAEEFEKLEQRIAELEPIEKRLNDMKVKSPDDIIREAEEKAQKILTDAEKLAKDVLDQAKIQKEKEREEIAILTNRKDRLINLINTALNKQKELVNLLSTESEEGDEIG
ncbi:MAG TPA: DivIVA domain-containing protein [Candidatus Marinimicrobia bacterium]|nr:DivIVA domain-containing protein [Candidatus Neomarinimicrobiota bacterium]